MKKILLLAPYPYLPFFSGGQKFIAQFLESLAEETELTVIGVETNDPATVTNYRLLPWLKKGLTRYMDLRLISRVSKEVKTGGYQTVIWEHPYFAWLAVMVRRRTGIPFLLHTHNIEHERFRSMGKWWWPLLKWYERWAFRKADRIYFITPEDKEFAMTKWAIPESRCADLPFLVNISEYPADKAIHRMKIGDQHGIGKADLLILFNGLLSYKPNLDALQVILQKINPILLTAPGLNYTIIVCGKALPETVEELRQHRDQHIIYAGFVDNIESYFKASDLFLNPVQSGGGIKTKMVEAIAYGATVVATETGATGIRKEVCGEKLLTVPDNDWDAFAQSVIDHRNTVSVTPAAYYAYYYRKEVAKRIAAGL